MIGRLRFDPPDSLIFEGHPEGTRIYQLGLPEGDELHRLYLYRHDLAQAFEWLEKLGDLENIEACREALAVAALVRFCSCFESTGGHRIKPLNRKRIFTPNERSDFAELKKLRDKMIVHDEQLYPNHLSWVALGSEGKAIEAGAFGISFGLSDMQQLDNLLRLVTKALNWTIAEFETIAKTVVETLNNVSSEELLKAMEQAGPINLKIKVSNQ